MLTPETTQRLQTEANIWLATVRPDGQPHLVPLWFAWHEGQIFLCTRPGYQASHLWGVMARSWR